MSLIMRMSLHCVGAIIEKEKSLHPYSACHEEMMFKDPILIEKEGKLSFIAQYLQPSRYNVSPQK